MRFIIFTLLFTALTVTSYASQSRKTVKLRLQAQNGYLDEATVYFDQGVSAAYAYQEDAELVLSGVAGVPVIYTVTSDNIHCSINGFGVLTSTQVVPIGIKVDITGNYNITAAMLDNFDPTSIITLEDHHTGRSIDLRTNFYTCHIDTADAPEGRFFIHVTYPSTFTTTTAGCANNDGELRVNTDTTETWDAYMLFDAYNNPIDTFLNVNSPVTFTGLAEGDYFVVRTFGAYSTSETYHVDGTYIVANIGASAIQVATEENIDFAANATNANHFSWDFGDGTLIIGVAHPDLAYYAPGVYTVTLLCTNDHGCVDSAQIQITVTQAVASGIKEETAKDILLTAHEKEVTINMNNVVNKGAQLQIYNIIGQSVSNTRIIDEVTTVSLEEQPTGYYIASVKNNEKVSTRRIFIGK